MLAGFLMASAGCQAIAVPQLAVLRAGDNASGAAMRAVLARVVGRPNAQLGPDNGTASPRVGLLPAPLAPEEGRSLAMPEFFTLELAGNICQARAADGITVHPLPGVTCVPFVQPATASRP
jgi:hypothetical protein